MRSRLSASTVVARPIEEVFDTIIDPQQYARLNPDIEMIEVLATDMTVSGARARYALRMGGSTFEILETVIETRRPTFAASDHRLLRHIPDPGDPEPHESDPAVFRFLYGRSPSTMTVHELEPLAPDRCRLTLRQEFDLGGLVGLIQWIAALVRPGLLRRPLEAVRDALEAADRT